MPASFCLARQGHVIIHTVAGSLWYAIAFIVNQKWKNKIYKVGKVDDRIPVLQLTRSRSKKQKETEI